MGIMSLLVKGGSKALGYGKRIAKVAPDALLGETSDVIGGAMRHTKGSLFTKGRAGFHALEKHVARQSKNGGFFTRVWKNLKSTPGAVAGGYKTAATAAKAAGKSGLWAGIKGGGKALLKKMPLIGAVLTVALEAPNIISAFKDGGFKAGMKEIGGAGVELGCMAGGAAIGSAICPGIGTAIGAVVGGFVGMFARGKTHSEKKAEKEAEAQAQAQAQQVEYSKEEVEALKSCGFQDEEIAQLQAAGYTMQDIEKAIEQEMKAVEQEQTNTQELQEAPIQSYDQIQAYDPTQAYAYNNLNSVPQTGLNNPYAIYPNMNMTNDKYANDIYYKQLFGTTPTVNPFNDYINNQYQYYV